MDTVRERQSIEKRYKEIVAELEELPERQLVLELEEKLKDAKKVLSSSQISLLEELLILRHRLKALERLEKGEDSSISPFDSVELVRDPLDTSLSIN